MKQKNEKLFKIGTLLLFASFLFTNCQKEEPTSFENPKNQIASYKVASLENLAKLKPIINNIKQIEPKTSGLARGFSDFLPLENIDTTKVIQFTDYTGYSTYTFKIESNDETSINFENLYLLETEQGYIGYILRYEPNPDWYSSHLIFQHGEYILDMHDYQGDITKYSFEREVIWSTKEENTGSSATASRGGQFVIECTISVQMFCKCEVHSEGNWYGCLCLEMGEVETCSSVWSGGSGSSGEGDGNGDGTNGGGGTGNDDDCNTKGTKIIDEQPISGVGSDCAPNDGTGIDGGNAMFALSNQLNQISGEGDSFSFDENVNPTNGINFYSVADFEAYINYVENQPADYIGSSVLLNGGDTVTRGMSFDIDPVLDTNLRVDVQQETNDSEPITILDVTSYLQGVTSFRDWTQNENYDVQTDVGLNKITVNLKGQMKTGVVINGYGLYYTQTYHLRLEFNLNTGELTNGWITLIE